MENKIAIGTFAGQLAQSTGKSKKLCDDFLREFFHIVGESLLEGESVKIKGFGTFKIADVESRNSINVNTGNPHEIASFKKVVFSPAKEFASGINAPFEEFKSVEIDDEMSEDLFLEEEILVNDKPEEIVEEESVEEEIETNPKEEITLKEVEAEKITALTGDALLVELALDEMKKEEENIVNPEKVSEAEKLEETDESNKEKIVEPEALKINLSDFKNGEEEIINLEEKPETEGVAESKEEVKAEKDAESEIRNENLVNDHRLEEGSKEEGEDDKITSEAYSNIENKPSSEKNHSMEEYNIESSEEIPHKAMTMPSQEKPSEKIENEKGNPDRVRHRHRRYYHAAYQPVPPQEIRKPSKKRFWMGFLLGALSTLVVCVIIFMLGCFFDWWPVNFGSPKEVVAAEEVAPEIETPEIEDQVQIETQTVEEPEPQPQPQQQPQPQKEPVYDTVSTTRYLTTIARDHYGNFNFWPYIYLENESKLGHPDRITPGTKVVIPDLSKYGVDPSKKEDEDKAKKKAVEIYTRFK